LQRFDEPIMLDDGQADHWSGSITRTRRRSAWGSFLGLVVPIRSGSKCGRTSAPRWRKTRTPTHECVLCPIH